MQDAVDFDEGRCYACSRSYKALFPTKPENIEKYEKLLCDIQESVSSEGDDNAFSIVSFEELSTPEAVLGSRLSSFRKCKFLKVGLWTSLKEDWKVALAVPLPSFDPFVSPEPPALTVIITYLFPSGMLDDIAVKDAALTISMSPYRTATSQIGIQSQSKTLYRTTGLEYTPSRSAQVFIVGAKDEWTFGRRPNILKVLDTFMGIPRCSEFTFNIELDYTIHITKRPNFSKLYEVVLIDDILENVTESLSLQDIASLRATTRSLAQKLRGLATRRVRVAFGRYFPDCTTQFAARLRITGAIVGGSFILSILCPGDWTPGDLDIIVPNHSRNAIAAFLVSQGYVKKPTTASDNLYPDYESGLFTYEQFFKETSSGGQLKIDLSVIQQSTKASPGDFILTYHSTPVMNLYNGHGIFCLFPWLTFEGQLMRNSYSPRNRLKHRTEECIRKYISRGFQEGSIGAGVQTLLGLGKSPLNVKQLPQIWYQSIDL